MLRKSAIVLGLLASMFWYGCDSNSSSNGGAETELRGPEGWKTLKAEEVSGVVYYPENWSIDTSGKMGTIFVVLSPVDSTNDFFQENITLSFEDVSEHQVSIDEYMEGAVSALQDYVTNIEGLTYEKRDGDYWVSYSGQQGIVRLAYNQRLMMHEGVAYILTYTSIVEYPSDHDSTAVEVMMNFHFEG